MYLALLISAKLILILFLIPIIVIGQHYLLKLLDEKDQRYSITRVQKDPIANALYGGAVYLGISIFTGLVVGLSIIGILL